MSGRRYTVHGVLAGAYKGRDIGDRALLYHASIDGGYTALCGRVKPESLCDWYEDSEVSCQTCIKKIAKMQLTRATVQSGEILEP